MTSFEIPYGRTTLTATLPDRYRPDIITLHPTPGLDDPIGAVNAALGELLGDADWGDFTGARSAAIAINDKTRPVPHQYLLPPLLQKLEGIGIPSGAITLLIATGLHERMNLDEFGSIVPIGVLERYPVLCHDANNPANLVNLGTTSRGTPILINRNFMQADLRIVVGNIEPHQFQGYSGGVKSAAIGLAGWETINHNHAMMTETGASLGQYDDNPARQDVEEIGRAIGVHLALNVVLNDQKKIVQVIAGSPFTIMKNGIPQAKLICQVRVPARYDIVIASPGGHPKDINIYQAQKGLAHAGLVTRNGGTLILVAACPEGSGSDEYERWVQAFDSNKKVLAQFNKDGFRVGPHKAYQIARDARRVKVLLVSEMEPDFVRRLLLKPAASLQDAVELSLKNLSPKARIGIMPNANATIPLIKLNE